MLMKILINLLIFVILSGGCIWYLKKLKLDHQGYKYLFIVYMFYWMSIMLLRPYRGTLQNIIDPNCVTIALACYGLVGIFMRVFADYLNFLVKNRKLFLYFGALIQVILFIPVLIVPNTATSLLQAVAIGIGASCIGSFELLFKEQYNQKQHYLTVSLLSIPPLMANFLTSPIQSLMMSAAKVNGVIDINIFKYMWIIGLAFALASFMMLFFVKEDRSLFGGFLKTSTNQIKSQREISNFILIAFLGLLITFIKFSNSGAVATLHLQKLGSFTSNDTSGYEGYLSMVFSLFQLLGGVLVGLVLIKRLKTITIFYMGSITWIIYSILAMFTTNPIWFMVIHGLNGFGYGILYNLVLGKVLSYNFKTMKVTPMGIYQSILSIGIMASSFYTNAIKDYFYQIDDTFSHYMQGNLIVDGGIIVAIILLSLAYSGNYYYFDNKKYQEYTWKL